MNAPFNPPTATAEPFRFTVDQFIALHEQGLFDDYAKSELIEGEIVVMNAQWSPHSRVKTRLAFELGLALRALNATLEPQIEVSVRVSDGSLPEPDIALTDYRGPGAVPVETVALLVEVTDTTHKEDLDRKARLYAASGILEYWVADLVAREIVQHSAPTATGYGKTEKIAFGRPVAAVTISGLNVDTTALD
jgi:Uma2 family endonuclease